MSTNEQSNCSRIVHRSIIREVVQTDSIESGCRSVDEDDPGMQSFVPNFEESQRTIVGRSVDDLRDTGILSSGNSASTESIPRRYTSVTPQSPSVSRKFQRFGRERLSSLSPNTHAVSNDLLNPLSSRSQSTESLPLAPLHETTTGDSGTGDSITQTPPDSSAESPHYNEIPVYGLDKPAFMPDRYAFDPAKIIAYRNKKYGSLPVASSGNPTHSGNEAKPKLSRPMSRDSKKSTGFLSRVRSFLVRTPPPNQTSFLPAIRHHPSYTSTDENQ